MSLLPARLEANAIIDPSGDQAGEKSTPGSCVIRRTAEPSSFITYISLPRSLVDAKAMREPSGDHAGKASSAGSSVRRIWLLPSLFITNISLVPSRAEAKAIRSPSGDQLARELLGVVRTERSRRPAPKR